MRRIKPTVCTLNMDLVTFILLKKFQFSYIGTFADLSTQNDDKYLHSLSKSHKRHIGSNNEEVPKNYIKDRLLWKIDVDAAFVGVVLMYFTSLFFCCCCFFFFVCVSKAGMFALCEVGVIEIYMLFPGVCVT